MYPASLYCYLYCSIVLFGPLWCLLLYSSWFALLLFYVLFVYFHVVFSVLVLFLTISGILKYSLLHFPVVSSTPCCSLFLLSILYSTLLAPPFCYFLCSNCIFMLSLLLLVFSLAIFCASCCLFHIVCVLCITLFCSSAPVVTFYTIFSRFRYSLTPFLLYFALFLYSTASTGCLSCCF